MTQFRDTDAAAQFIASADSRNTSREIMDAIAFFARDINEAEALWEGDALGVANIIDIWENVTSNGLRDAEEFFWGAAGNQWFKNLSI